VREPRLPQDDLERPAGGETAPEGRVNAYAMLATCARHQLSPDSEQLDVSGERAWLIETLRPNLMLLTGPEHVCSTQCPIPDNQHPMLLPMLEVRPG
jgi:hypothetical protein